MESWIRSKPKDNTALWSRFATKRHRFNRLDPNPDPESDTSPQPSRPTKKDKEGLGKLVMTPDDWKKFWAQRLRQFVDAPNLTDKDLTDIVERNRRLYFRRKEEKVKPAVDEDLPQAYYWDKFKVAEWAESTGLPIIIKEMFLNSDICGRKLVTLDASTLLKLGLYDLNMIQKVTQAIREVLGLPPPNGLRAICRTVPLEMFLKMKVRTGPHIDGMTFKDFCEIEGIEYEPARKQKTEGYRPRPDECYVEIKPRKQEKVKWIPVEMRKPKPKDEKRSLLFSESDNDFHISEVSTTTSNDSLYGVPTVEQLTNDAFLRNSFMPQILNEIVESVFKKMSENKRLQRETTQNSKLAEQVLKSRLEEAYTDFSITNAEDKLKFVTIIAEELVEDILRAREIIQDIDKFQERMHEEIEQGDFTHLQEAVSHYVQTLMPLVVNAALKEMEESSLRLNQNHKLDRQRSDSIETEEEDYDDFVLSY